MRNGLLFVHIISASVLVGLLDFKNPICATMPKKRSEAKVAIFLQARASHFLNMGAVVFLLLTGYLLAQNFGGIAAHRWIWVSLVFTAFAAVFAVLAGNQEEQLSRTSIVTGWSEFFKLWSVEITLSTSFALMVLYLMVAKSL